MNTSHERPGRQPGPIEAFSEVVQSSQDVVMRRIEVLRLETLERFETLRGEVISLIAAAILAVSAWALCLGGVVILLAKSIGLAPALLALGATLTILAFVILRLQAAPDPTIATGDAEVDSR